MGQPRPGELRADFKAEAMTSFSQARIREDPSGVLKNLGIVLLLSSPSSSSSSSIIVSPPLRLPTFLFVFDH